MSHEKEIDDDDEKILQTLEQNDGLHIEDVAEKLDMDYEEAREAVHDLWNRNLVSSGPMFTFHAAREDPPKLA